MTTHRRFPQSAWMAAAATLLVPSLCLAHGLYVGVDVGRGSERLNCLAGARCDHGAAAVDLRIGYRFTPRWGVEIEAIGIGPTSAALDRGLGAEPGQVRVGGTIYQGTATWARGPWSVTTRLGVAANVARSTFADYPTRDRTTITAAAGVEVSYRFAGRWRVALAEEHRPNVALTGHSRASVNALTVGVRYEFGR